jgi:hypothetical protein
MSGYYTIPLTTPVSVTSGQRFSVVVHYTSAPTYPTATEGYYAGYSSACTANLGESFYSSNGTSWTDFSTTYASYEANANIKAYVGGAPLREDVLGIWGSGDWVWNSQTKGWTNLCAPSLQVTCGDLDGDNVDDIIGVWSSGLWVYYSATKVWSKYSSTIPYDISAGDMNGDGRADLVASWSNGNWYRNSISGTWVKMSTASTLIAAGDVDNDGTDDMVGTWSSGLWYKGSVSGTWTKVSTALPTGLACGDFTGDGRDDIAGIWTSGTWYYNPATAGWTKLSEPSTKITCGDIDGDSRADLIGAYSSGLWGKHSSTSMWEKITGTNPTDVASGPFAGTVWGAGELESADLRAGKSGFAVGPDVQGQYVDLSDEGPGGSNFVFVEEKRLTPSEDADVQMQSAAGPGEPGFSGTEERNLTPRESAIHRRVKK